MIAYVFQKYPENFALQLFITLPMKFAIFLKSSLLFKQFLLSFLFINKTLQLNNLKTRTAMNGKISVFVICVKVIIYLLIYHLHDCTCTLKFYLKSHPTTFLKLSSTELLLILVFTVFLVDSLHSSNIDFIMFSVSHKLLQNLQQKIADKENCHV